MHSRRWALAAVLLTASVAASAAPDPGSATEFKAMREAYAASPGFSGRFDDHDLHGRMLEARKAKRTKKFLELSAAWLVKCPVDADAHRMRAKVLAEAGDEEGAAHHRAQLDGLLQSILAFGDGRSVETAWRVIAVDEEYTVLRSLGVESQTQTVMRASGAVLDVHDVMLDSKPTKLYFDVTIGWDAMARALQAGK